MVSYPKLGIFRYKDKNLDIKVPIRCKKIELKFFKCVNEKCELRFTERLTKSQLTKIKQNSAFKSISKSNDELFTDFEKKYSKFKEGDLCPLCEKELAKGVKNLYKMYGHFKNRYVNVGEILNMAFYARFKKEHPGQFFNNAPTYASFCSGVEAMKEGLKLKEPKRDTEIFTFEPVKPFPTQEQIDEAFEEWKSWKIAKEL